MCYTHVFQMLSNNQTYLECKSDVLYISMQIQTPKCKFQQSNLSKAVKTVKPYDWFVSSLGSVATPFALILNDKSLKLHAVFRWLYHQNSSFILQETYSSKECENTWKAEWGGEIVFNRGTNHSKGTMILFHPNLNFKSAELKQKNVQVFGNLISHSFTMKLTCHCST